jgi:hypothetical protein
MRVAHRVMRRVLVTVAFLSIGMVAKQWPSPWGSRTPTFFRRLPSLRTEKPRASPWKLFVLRLGDSVSAPAG